MTVVFDTQAAPTGAVVFDTPPPAPVGPTAQAPQAVGGGAADAFTKGVTFGLGPLITAGESALLGRKPGAGTFDLFDFEGTFGERFDEALAAERAQNVQFREERPGVAATAEIGGSLASLFAAPGATLTRFGGKTAAGKIVAGGAEGAAIGAGFAAGEGRDIEEGALTGAAFGAGGATLIRGVQAVAGGMGQFVRGSELLATSPTLQQLKTKTRRLYTAAKKSGVRFKDDEYEQFVNGLEAEFKSRGARPVLTPKAIAVLEELKKEIGTSPDFQTMDELRRVARIAADSIEKPEQALGSIVIDAIDEFVESGSASLGKTAGEARKLWGRVRRDEQVAAAIERARQNVSGIDQGLRVEFRKILTNPKKARGFTPAEIKSMEQIVQGTSTSNTLRSIGKLGFSTQKSIPNVVGGGIGAGAGFAVGGAPGVVAVQAAGVGSRLGAEALQARNARVLGAMVRAGKPQGQITAASRALERIGDNERAFQGFVRSLGTLGAGNE